MAKCEQFETDGTCYPGIDMFDPIEFVKKQDLSKPGLLDTFPYCWNLKAKIDIPHPNPEFHDVLELPAGKTQEYWICEDCHLLCEINLVATQPNQE